MARLRSLLCGAAASLLLAIPAQAATIALWTGPLDPSSLLSYFNTLITQINTSVTPATAGTGNISAAVNTPSVSAAVNAVQITAGATTVAPQLSIGDSFGATSDSNIGIVMSGKGTGSACLGGTTCANASLSAPTTASAVNQIVVTGKATGTPPTLVVGGSGVDTNVGLFVAGNGTGPVYIGGTSTTLAGLQVAQTASRVNAVLVTPGATGSVPTITSGGAGADSNIGLQISASGTGTVRIGGTTATAGLQVAQTASAVNNIVVTNAATGNVPSIAVGGASVDTNRNLSVAGSGTGIVALGQAIATCTGTTTATCQGQRFIVSITGLTTAAAGTESAAMTVTNASVASASSVVHCQTNIYAGTGNPIATRITPGTGQVSMTVTNVAGSGSLNATVPLACVVF